MENTLKQALNSFIAPYTGFLKSSEFSYTLAILRFIMLHCSSKKNNPVSLALRAFQSYENFLLYPNSASVLKLS